LVIVLDYHLVPPCNNDMGKEEEAKKIETIAGLYLQKSNDL